MISGGGPRDLPAACVQSRPAGAGGRLGRTVGDAEQSSHAG
jgi:hypothetical protein